MLGVNQRYWICWLVKIESCWLENSAQLRLELELIDKLLESSEYQRKHTNQYHNCDWNTDTQNRRDH